MGHFSILKYITVLSHGKRLLQRLLAEHEVIFMSLIIQLCYTTASLHFFMLS